MTKGETNCSGTSCARCGKRIDPGGLSLVRRCAECLQAEEIEKTDRSRKREFVRYMESNPLYFRMIVGTRQKTPAQLFREVIDARIKWYDEGLKGALRLKQFRLQTPT